MVGCSTTGGGGTGPVNPPDQPKFDCQNPVGGVVKHGESVTLFQAASVQFGATCMAEVRMCDNGKLSGTFKEVACEVMPEQEPVTHEAPVKISDEGLKQGTFKLLGTKHIVVKQSRMFSPPPPVIPACSVEPIPGTLCAQGTPACMHGNYDYTCTPKATYKAFGWVYEKNGLVHTPAEGVDVGVSHFAQCVNDQRGCIPLAGPVKTDKWGYFEFTTGHISDTLFLEGLPKYYAHCVKGKPYKGGGQSISSKVIDQPTGPFKQLLVKEDSCKQNFIMKMFTEEVPENFNPNEKPIE